MTFPLQNDDLKVLFISFYRCTIVSVIVAPRFPFVVVVYVNSSYKKSTLSVNTDFCLGIYDFFLGFQYP